MKFDYITVTGFPKFFTKNVLQNPEDGTKLIHLDTFIMS